MDLYAILCRVSILCFAAVAVFAELQQEILQATECMATEGMSVMTSFHGIARCYTEQLGIDERFLKTSNFEDVTKKVCSLKDPKVCIMETTAELRQTCLTTPFLKEGFVESVRNLEVIYKYACYEEGKRIIELYKNGGVHCVQQLYSDPNATAAHCFKTHLDALKNEMEALGDSQEAYHEVDCRLANELSKCITESMTLCPKPKEFMEGLYDEVFKASDCNKYLVGSSRRIEALNIFMFLLASLLTLLHLS